tara:strand:+ start:700 stop:1203 length:504 start_codon:yes stop_codon:yes gene_type:complete
MSATSVKNEIMLLQEPFWYAANWLLQVIHEENLPLKVYETKRTEDRQNLLKARGNSKASFGESPHNFGLAMDLVLDVKKIKVREREWKGKMYPDAWDDSTPAAVDVWQRLGEICNGMNLVWGGHWIKDGGKIRKNSKGQEIVLGWDLPHVEMKSWRKYKHWVKNYDS